MQNDNPTLADVLVNVACQDSATYKRMLSQFSEYDREALIDRRAKLIIAGSEGGTYNLRTTSFGIFHDQEVEEPDLTIWLEERTLEDIIVHIAQKALGIIDEEDPGVSPRQAYAHGDIMIKGRRAIYHASEIMELLDTYFFNNELVIKIAVEAFRALQRVKEEAKCKK
jgi:hypothetical protein